MALVLASAIGLWALPACQMGSTNLNHIEQQLIEARDALVTYWEQSEGQTCLLSLSVAGHALSEWRALNDEALRACDEEDWRRITALADEVTRLFAPIAGAM